jgi:hypothetical protein
MASQGLFVFGLLRVELFCQSAFEFDFLVRCRFEDVLKLLLHCGFFLTSVSESRFNVSNAPIDLLVQLGGLA